GIGSNRTVWVRARWQWCWLGWIKNLFGAPREMLGSVAAQGEAAQLAFLAPILRHTVAPATIRPRKETLPVPWFDGPTSEVADRSQSDRQRAEQLLECSRALAARILRALTAWRRHAHKRRTTRGVEAASQICPPARSTHARGP